MDIGSRLSARGRDRGMSSYTARLRLCDVSILISGCLSSDFSKGSAGHHARRDWIQWVVSAERAETRSKRIDSARDMLAKGKRRPCCFDRSGLYSQSLSAPSPTTRRATQGTEGGRYLGILLRARGTLPRCSTAEWPIARSYNSAGRHALPPAPEDGCHIATSAYQRHPSLRIE